MKKKGLFGGQWVEWLGREVRKDGKAWGREILKGFVIAFGRGFEIFKEEI